MSISPHLVEISSTHHRGNGRKLRHVSMEFATMGLRTNYLPIADDGRLENVRTIAKFMRLSQGRCAEAAGMGSA